MKQVKTTFWIAICLLCIYMLNIPQHTVNASSQTAEEKFKKIDDYIRAEMKLAHVPGLSLGIVHEDHIVYLSGYGDTGVSGHTISSQTPFVLGSTSKSFTAMAIMQLVEAGKINLDTPVQQYIPWVQIGSNNEASRITVRNLLNQTSGISKSENWSNVKQVQETLGTGFEYSNANYELLGQIIASVANMPYGEYVKQHLFSPLEMKHTYVSQSEAAKDGLTPGHRTWFGFNFAKEMPYPEDSIPAGFIISSAEDMSHYLIAQMNRGRYKDRLLVSESSIVDMHTPHVKAPMLGPDSFYGMGWFIVPKNGVPTVFAPGDVSNYHSTMIIMPEQRYGIVLLANATNQLITSPLIEKIAEGVSSILAGKQPDTIGGSTYYLKYILLDSILLIFISITCIHAFNVTRWYKRLINGRLSLLMRIFQPLLTNLLIPFVILVLIPKFIGFPWSYLYDFAPDIAVVLSIIAIVLLAVGGLKLYFIIRIGLFKKGTKKDAASL